MIGVLYPINRMRSNDVVEGTVEWQHTNLINPTTQH